MVLRDKAVIQRDLAVGIVIAITRFASDVPHCLIPLSLPDPSGVEDSNRNNGDGNHGALKNHKSDFIVGKGAVKATGQLGATKDGSNDDSDGGSAQCKQPVVERLVSAKVVELAVETVARGLANAEEKVGAQSDEKRQAGDLPGDTGNHDVDTDV